MHASNTHETQIELFVGVGDGHCCSRERTIPVDGSAQWWFVQHGPDDVLTYKAYETLGSAFVDGRIQQDRGELVYCIRASERQIVEDGGVLMITRNVPRGIFDEPADPCPEAAAGKPE